MLINIFNCYRIFIINRIENFLFFLKDTYDARITRKLFNYYLFRLNGTFNFSYVMVSIIKIFQF